MRTQFGLLLGGCLLLCGGLAAIPSHVAISDEPAPFLAPRVPLSTSTDRHFWTAKGKSAKKSKPPSPNKSGGDSEAAKRGREEHKNWQPGEGYEKEVTLPSGKRADAVNWEKRDVKELKPDNPRAVRRGERQLEGYKQELEDTTGEEWTGRVETYKK